MLKYNHLVVWIGIMYNWNRHETFVIFVANLNVMSDDHDVNLLRCWLKTLICFLTLTTQALVLLSKVCLVSHISEISTAISRINEPIPDMFVLIWMHFSLWFQILWSWNSTILTFFTNFVNILTCRLHSPAAWKTLRWRGCLSIIRSFLRQHWRRGNSSFCRWISLDASWSWRTSQSNQVSCRLSSFRYESWYKEIRNVSFDWIMQIQNFK